MNRIISLALFLAVFSINVCAFESVELDKVKEHAVRILVNTPIDTVNKTPIRGLYELRAKANIFYFSPESEYFFFGEMYNKDGKRITRIKQESALRDFLVKNQDKAILIGDPNATNVIYEFTDPLCPFCHKYEKYIQQKEDVKRYVFLYYPAHAEANVKVTHILCSADKASAMKAIFNHQVKNEDLISCEEGISLGKEHISIAKQVKAKGTPTLFVNNTKIGGFSAQAIDKLLVPNKKSEVLVFKTESSNNQNSKQRVN
ncbi:MAG: DsbC family protein [Alteromonadaceae bacterium]|nr:DsbC family protein [Alteromonadaceae bacterium]